MSWLKVSTAVTLPIGPFVSVGNGNTEKTALTITKAMVKISKNNGVLTSKAVANTAQGGTSGWYRISFSVTDANTLGNFLVYVHPANVLPVWARFDIVNSVAYNAFRGVGGWNLKANAITAGVIGKGAFSATKFATKAVTDRIIATDAIHIKAIAPAALRASVFGPKAIAESKLDDGIFSNRTLANGAISAAKIAPLTLTNAKFGTNAINGRIVSANTISAAKVAQYAIHEEAIAAGALRASTLGYRAIQEARFATGAISARVLAAGVVSNSKIANLTFSATKFATNAVTNRNFGTTAVNKIVTANNAAVIDGTVTRKKLEKLLLGMAAGDMRFSVGVYYIKDQAGATIYTLTINDTDRDATVI